MTGQCPCTSPTDAYLCNVCVAEFLKDLRGVPDLLAELHTTGAKLDVMGGSGGGGSVEAPMGVNIGALEVKGTLEHLLLAMWIRCGLEPRRTDPITYVEGITSAVHVLAGHKSAASYRDQLAAEVRKGWELVDKPKHVIRLGRCATLGCGDDITALDGHKETRCQSCGETYNVAETRAGQKSDALAYVNDKTGTPAQLGRLFKELGVRIPTGTIYRWISDNTLTPVGKNLKGNDVYMVSDLLEIKATRYAKKLVG
jgi:hypothetical protein